MLERLFTGRRLLAYLHWKDRIPIPLAVLGACVVIGVPILILVLWVLAFLKGFDSIGFYRADVLHSTIRETEFSRTLHIRSKTKAGEEFYIITRKRPLYAVAGSEICLEVFEQPENGTRRAAIASFDKCEVQ